MNFSSCLTGIVMGMMVGQCLTTRARTEGERNCSFPTLLWGTWFISAFFLQLICLPIWKPDWEKMLQTANCSEMRWKQARFSFPYFHTPFWFLKVWASCQCYISTNKCFHIGFPHCCFLVKSKVLSYKISCTEIFDPFFTADLTYLLSNWKCVPA